jgi:hypothetical protein
MGSPALARAALACVLTLLLAAPASASTTHVFGGKKRAGGTYVFKLAKLRSATVKSARLVRRHVRRRVDRDVVSRAAARGRLRVKPRGRLRRCRVRRCRLRLRVRVRDEARPSAADPATQPQQGTQPPAPRGPSVTSACEFGTFDVGNWPGACWRPYSDASPFNRRLPASPPIAADSDAVVGHIADWGPPTPKLQARGADYAPDHMHPWYLSRPSDPEFTIHCVADYGRPCRLEGMKLRIPDAAQPANAEDHHMSVIDQATNWEYDFWQVRSKPQGGGRLDVSWGGRTRIGTPDATGLGGGGTAAGFAHLAGIIRAPEVEALDIPHALFMVVRCDSGKVVFPADGYGTPCSYYGEADGTAPAMGQHLYLAMSDEQIDALGAPPLQRAVLRAMARYGLFVGDTGGNPWNLRFESDNTYTSFGFPGQVASAFQAQGARHYVDSTYNSWNVDTVPVDWRRYLRVVDPCYSAGSC